MIFPKKSLLTIGKQGITFSVDELKSWAKQTSFALDNSHLAASIAEKRQLTDTEFFKSIGFPSVDSMDVSEYEGASVICNLNNDIPSELYNRFDVVFDGGSTEHMFNVPKVFENYNKMLKIGGLIIHSLPSTGCLDHGFYMFSPTLFYDYYSQNKWKIEDFFMIKIPHEHYSSWSIYKYDEPGPSLEAIDFPGRWGIFFIARKQEESTYGYNIEQHLFKKLWENNPINTAGYSSDLPEISLLKRAFRMLPETTKAAIRLALIKIRKFLSFKKRIPFKKIDLLR